MASLKIGIIGDYDAAFPPHPQTDYALQHIERALGIEICGQWIPTNEMHEYRSFNAFWCAPGSPYKSLDGALKGVRFARENRVPLLGTCGGFQHVVLEYARNVMGIEDAAHAEYDPYASNFFIQPLSCSLRGKSMPIQMDADSLAARIYGCTSAVESYYCNFGLNPDYQETLHNEGLRISAWDEQNEVRIVELPDHPFYLATLFVPQSRSTERAPHPLIRAFVKAALANTN